MSTWAKAPQHRQKLRWQVISHYGALCGCCGEKEPVFLVLDHIDGGGHRHKESIGKRGTGFYYWIIQNNFPSGYQVLCQNCNWAKRMGECPHNIQAVGQKVTTPFGSETMLVQVQPA